MSNHRLIIKRLIQLSVSYTTPTLGQRAQESHIDSQYMFVRSPKVKFVTTLQCGGLLSYT